MQRVWDGCHGIEWCGMASITQRDPSWVSLHARCLWEPQTGAASSESVVIKISRYNKNKRKCERTLYALVSPLLW